MVVVVVEMIFSHYKSTLLYNNYFPLFPYMTVMLMPMKMFDSLSYPYFLLSQLAFNSFCIYIILHELVEKLVSY